MHKTLQPKQHIGVSEKIVQTLQQKRINFVERERNMYLLCVQSM